MKILLVDDHAVVRQGYASLLKALLPEVTVSEAASGEQALEQVRNRFPAWSCSTSVCRASVGWKLAGACVSGCR